MKREMSAKQQLTNIQVVIVSNNTVGYKYEKEYGLSKKMGYQFPI